MFGGLKVGGALRAKAFAKMQADNERKKEQQRAAAEAKSAAKAGEEQEGVEVEWDLPDPRTEWETMQIERQIAAEKNAAEAEERMSARAAAAGKQAERRRQHAEAAGQRPATSHGRPTGTGGEAGAAEGPSPADGVSYVTVYVTYRGLATPSRVLLTADEFGAYTVRTLKQRIARESGVESHADAKVVHSRPQTAGSPRATYSPEGNMLLDDMPLRSCIRNGDHITLRAREKENTRPQSACLPGAAGAAQRAERARQLEAEALWRGHRTDDSLADLHAATTSQLTKFVKQAGGTIQAAWSAEELKEAAEGWRAEWEVNRVLMCHTDFEVLRLNDSQTPLASEVKSAFRKASMQVHPDKNKSSQSNEAMRRVTKAYAAMMSRAVTVRS